MLLPRKAQGGRVELRQLRQVRVGGFETGVPEDFAAMALEDKCAAPLEEIDRQPRIEPIADVKPLRDGVEGEGDQCPVVGACAFCLRKGSLQQRVPDAAALMLRGNEQLG